MPFVKLDCKMLDSSLWPEKDQRDLFITALLMAEPIELVKPTRQIKVRSLDFTEFYAPPGWYGFVPAAGIGIINRCGMDTEVGLSALEALGDPDPESRSNDYEGRRLIRIDGGYLALNFDKYRERDYSNAERCKRYREKKKAKDMPCHSLQHACQHESDMQAEAEAEAEAEVKEKKEEYSEDFECFWSLYPRKEGKGGAYKVWNKIKPSKQLLEKMLLVIASQKTSKQWMSENGKFIPHPKTWLNEKRWDDEIEVKKTGMEEWSEKTFRG